MKITSEAHLLATDRHVRVTAGPGAGKTYWFVGHIKNVLTRSEKLHANSRIAVISYTNVAADQLKEQLGIYAARAEVATIHSFLYRNVVRPYVHFLREAGGRPLVNSALLDGHDEHHVNYLHLKAWLTSRNLQNLTTKFQKEQLEMLRQHIATIRWRQAETFADWHLELSADYGLSQRTKAQLGPDSLFAYKQPYWRDGTIDHDDVLYFAFRILQEYPVVRDCLSGLFPFVFIDEFQDTVPAQTHIVRWLAAAGSTVVVIGDAEQAIFEFAGAAPAQFRTFTLPELDEYEITHNRRSTQAIIAILNRMRNDGIIQECFRGALGAPVQLLVGAAVKAARHVRAVHPGRPPLILARNQNIVDDVLADNEMLANDPWSGLVDVDPRRSNFLKSVCAALTLVRSGRLNVGVATMLRGIRHENEILKEPFKSANTYSALHRQAIALTILESLLSRGNSLDSLTVRAAYDDLSNCLSEHFSGLSLSKITKGLFASRAEQLKMKELAESVRLENKDEVRDIRTIHKAKGTEADCVLVCLHSPRGDHRLRHITAPTIPSDEEQRLTYVALSRARDALFLAVPELTQEDEGVVREIGLTITRLA
jgi:DNA helicase-2/ATP-dependent DNA helicase PcrA